MKSIDFTWNYHYKDKTLKFYATHKHTSEDGGAQDNQFNDVKEFNSNAMVCDDNNIYFFSITDGAYYSRKYVKDKDFEGSRLEYYNYKFKGKRNKATKTNDLLQDMIPVIIEWLEMNFDSDEIIEEKAKLEHVMKSVIIHKKD